MQNGRVPGNRIAICPSGSRVVMFHVKAEVDLLLVQHAKGRSTCADSRSAWYCIAPIDSVDVEVVTTCRRFDRALHYFIRINGHASEEIVELGDGTETQHLGHHPLVDPASAVSSFGRLAQCSDPDIILHPRVELTSIAASMVSSGTSGDSGASIATF